MAEVELPKPQNSKKIFGKSLKVSKKRNVRYRKKVSEDEECLVENIGPVEDWNELTTNLQTNETSKTLDEASVTSPQLHDHVNETWTDELITTSNLQNTNRDNSTSKEDAGDINLLKSSEDKVKLSDNSLHGRFSSYSTSCSDEFSIVEINVVIEKGREDTASHSSSKNVNRLPSEIGLTNNSSLDTNITPQTSCPPSVLDSDKDKVHQNTSRILSHPKNKDQQSTANNFEDCCSKDAKKNNKNRKSGLKLKRKKKHKKKINLEAVAEGEEEEKEEEEDFNSIGGKILDSETIEIIELDEEEKKKARKEKNKKRKRKSKRLAKKAGLTMWKGLREGWKLMWSGLAMYTLPIGSLDVAANITKIWSTKSPSAKTY